MATTAKKPSASELDAVAARVEALMRLQPSCIDAEALRCLIGDVPSLSTLRDVSRVFGASRNTVQTSWRGGDMPGEQGRYDVAEILCWLLRREASRTSGVSTNGKHSERDAIELESMKALLDIRRHKAARERGEWVPLVAVRSAFGGILNVLRDALCGIPQAVEPMLPARQAKQLSAEVDRAIRNALTAAAETPVDDIVERIRTDDKRAVATNYE